MILGLTIGIASNQTTQPQLTQAPNASWLTHWRWMCPITARSVGFSSYPPLTRTSHAT